MTFLRNLSFFSDLCHQLAEVSFFFALSLLTINLKIHLWDTDDAPVFPKVWAQIEPLIEGLPLVAHNKPFDESCLKAVFRVYQMDYPDYEFYDTLCVSRRVLPDLENHQLQTVAAACGFNMENHHHALADAEACAWIAREIL